MLDVLDLGVTIFFKLPANFFVKLFFLVTEPEDSVFSKSKAGTTGFSVIDSVVMAILLSKNIIVCRDEEAG
jgi:hypothetical protein